MLIFASINEFTYGWISAVIAQFCGHVVFSFFIIRGYSDKLDAATIFVPILNFNVGLIVAAFLYHSSEYQSRYITFLKWSIEKVGL